MNNNYKPKSFLRPDTKELRHCGRSFAILAALRAARQSPDELIPYLCEWAERFQNSLYADAKEELQRARLEKLYIDPKIADRMMNLFGSLGSAREFGFENVQSIVERVIQLFLKIDDDRISLHTVNGWNLS